MMMAEIGVIDQWTKDQSVQSRWESDLRTVGEIKWHNWGKVSAKSRGGIKKTRTSKNGDWRPYSNNLEGVK